MFSISEQCSSHYLSGTSSLYRKLKAQDCMYSNKHLKIAVSKIIHTQKKSQLVSEMYDAAFFLWILIQTYTHTKKSFFSNTCCLISLVYLSLMRGRPAELLEISTTRVSDLSNVRVCFIYSVSVMVFHWKQWIVNPCKLLQC